MMVRDKNKIDKNKIRASETYTILMPCMSVTGPEFFEARGEIKIWGPLYVYDSDSTKCNKQLIMYVKAIFI